MSVCDCAMVVIPYQCNMLPYISFNEMRADLADLSASMKAHMKSIISTV